MNWTMGRYIDALDDEARDLLITAPEFNNGGNWHLRGCGCLVGTACGGTYNVVERVDPAEWLRFCRVDYNGPWPGVPASVRYPRAVERFGKPRVVKAIKARAVRGVTSRVVESPNTSTVEAV